MERPIVLVYKGHLIYVDQGETSIELESVGYLRQSGFCGELVSKSKLTSKLHWDIEYVNLCVDDRTGIDTLFVLALCQSRSAIKQFCIIQGNWRGSDVFSHISNSNTKSTREPSVELMPLLEFKCDTDVSKSSFCALTHGPRALIVGQNKILLFGRKTKEWNIVQKNEFSILDTDIAQYDLLNTTSTDASASSSTSSDSQRHIQIESKILSVISEQDWIVALLLISKKTTSASLVAIALERNAKSGEFSCRGLCTLDFLPQVYAPKVSTVTIQACRRTVVADQSHSYENVCTVGLNDGYVMTFASGMMQTCVTPWTHIDALYPAFAVTEVLPFNDVLICHMDTKDCFVVNGTTSKVSTVFFNLQLLTLRCLN